MLLILEKFYLRLINQKYNKYIIYHAVEFTKNHMNCFEVLYKPQKVTKLHVHNIPLGQYTMRINGSNVMTAKANYSNIFVGKDIQLDSLKEHMYTFDFTHNLSDMFKSMCTAMNVYDFGCVDLSKFDTIEIFYPKNTKLLDTGISLIYEYDDETMKRVSLNLKTYMCGINFLTESITCHVTPPINPKWKLSARQHTNIQNISKSPTNGEREFAYSLRFLINGELTMSVHASDPTICIRTTDLEQKFVGVTNNYIPEHLHKKLLNFSKVESFAIECVNCTLDKVTQACYMIYDLDTRGRLFAN